MMVEEKELDIPLSRNDFSQNEHGFLDNVWAFFLNDYDNLEEDKISLESQHESLSHEDEHESVENEEISVKEQDLEAGEEEVKKSILAASLKRSSKLLAYFERLDAAKKTLARDRERSINRGVMPTKNCVSRNLECRDCKSQDKVDIGSVRDKPPKIIFIEEEDTLVGSFDVNGTSTQYVRRFSPIAHKRGEDFEINRKVSVYDEKGIHRQKSEAYAHEHDELKAAKRKELLRRIAILRIRASEARMSRIEF